MFWGKRQKSCLEPLTDRIERESLKNFEKVYEHVINSIFKKLSIRFSTGRKLDSISWKCFDWSNTNWAPIETDKDSYQILITILIDRKTGSISQNSGKISFLKNTTLLCRNSLKHWILWRKKKSMSMRWNAFSKTLVLNPIFPKLRFSIKTLIFSNLVGQTKITHNSMYKV